MDFIEKAISDLMGKFSKDIEIHLSPNLVSFYRGANSIQTKPVIYISDTPKKPRVLAVGEGAVLDEPHFKIDVFNFSDTSSKTNLNPFDCLTAFFRHCITKVVDTIAIIRPKIIVHNIESLENLLKDAKEETIEKALYESGARVCVFKQEMNNDN